MARKWKFTKIYIAFPEYPPLHDLYVRKYKVIGRDSSGSRLTPWSAVADEANKKLTFVSHTVFPFIVELAEDDKNVTTVFPQANGRAFFYTCRVFSVHSLRLATLLHRISENIIPMLPRCLAFSIFQLSSIPFVSNWSFLNEVISIPLRLRGIDK